MQSAAKTYIIHPHILFLTQTQSYHFMAEIVNFLKYNYLLTSVHKHFWNLSVVAWNMGKDNNPSHGYFKPVTTHATGTLNQ